MNTAEVNLLLGIFEKLSRRGDPDDLRRNVAEELPELRRADLLPSFIWNRENRTFDRVVFLNMPPETLSATKPTSGSATPSPRPVRKGEKRLRSRR